MIFLINSISLIAVITPFVVIFICGLSNLGLVTLLIKTICLKITKLFSIVNYIFEIFLIILYEKDLNLEYSLSTIIIVGGE